ncbi:MAG TPA: flavodoxin domain-containing protein [Burkholderiales bacterium]|nr:flavodoxin domain-containing protein [Burkholderiales bacterium]
MKLHLLVGTMTGTAQLVAQELELVWDTGGDTGGDGGEMQVETLLMDKLDSGVFAREGIFLIVTSTYGQGDVPDNAKNFYEDLKARRPDLSRVRYGVFGLGDRTYAETFNFGGKRFDDVLRELGAQRIGERVQHDASSGVLPEEMAVEWGEGWLALVREAVAA